MAAFLLCHVRPIYPLKAVLERYTSGNYKACKLNYVIKDRVRRGEARLALGGGGAARTRQDREKVGRRRAADARCFPLLPLFSRNGE